MAPKKKAKTTAKTMGKKDLKRTKGGILIGLNQPVLGHKIEGIKVETTTPSPLDYKIKW